MLRAGSQAVCFGEAGHRPEHQNRLCQVHNSPGLAPGLRHQALHCRLHQGDVAAYNQKDQKLMLLGVRSSCDPMRSLLPETVPSAVYVAVLLH